MTEPAASSHSRSPESDFEDGIENAVEKAVPRARSWLWLLLQVACCVAIFWIVTRLDLVDFSLLSGILDHPVAIAAAFLLTLATLPLAALRWFLLMRAQSVDVGFRPTLRMTCIAVAGNALILGGIGGEVARIAFAARRTKGQRTAALTSIVIDRVLAMFGVLVVGAAMVPSLASVIRISPVLTAGAGFLAGGFLAAIAAMTIAIAASGGNRIAALIDAWLRPRWLATTILRTMAAIACYRTRWRVLVTCAALSALNALTAPLALYIFCQTQAISDLGFSALAYAASFATIANLVPISPGGLGVGEGVFAQICALLGGGATAQYGTIFLGNRAVSTLAFLCGLLALIGHKHPAGGRR
jgi:uncharacterized protein (TIRG00374 family)